MKNNTCETCGVAVRRVPKGEGRGMVVLEPGVVRRDRVGRRRARVLDAGKAFLPDHMAERLDLRQTPAQRHVGGMRRRPTNEVDEYEWHLEHQCGGR
ncbi:hypothetical protein [Aeromicrobium endophyticum]|uniref:Uncharacterized protein n=1 Tax=Aeromicrobium endophyticum TaxID=2292704 RepID=A0A371PE31_9ACTN|nr:hypothetical protein [Aeromicrobium endophyticum]REK73670.1 hypothetical protein DX116_09100 [Aeromicrobium endophyticum]